MGEVRAKTSTPMLESLIPYNLKLKDDKVASANQTRCKYCTLYIDVHRYDAQHVSSLNVILQNSLRAATWNLTALLFYASCPLVK